MGFMPAVELSYIKPKNQRLIAVSIDGEQASPSLAQAKRLRELDKDPKVSVNSFSPEYIMPNMPIEPVSVVGSAKMRFAAQEM